MLTRREVVIEKPFQDKRYSDHRKKVTRALPRIDVGPPAEYSHLDVKMKKLRLEKDRQNKICEDNLRLVHRLAIIMRTKRMDDINTSSKGPFEKKRFKLPRPVKVKSMDDRSESIETSDGKTFLEKITREAMRRAPVMKKKLIQHRAPHGFCPVPELGITFLNSARVMSHIRRRELVYSISTNSVRRFQGYGNTSVDGSESYVECQNKSTQISLSDLNQTSETNNFTSTMSLNENSTIEETDEPDAESDREIARKIIEQDDTPASSEAEDDTVISCSGFTEIEKNGSAKTSIDSDEQITSLLLGSTPNITIDEPSDNDFFG